MAVINLTVLTLLLPLALARPGGDHHAHAHMHERRHLGTGVPGPFSGSIPFPVGNNTGAPIGTGTGVAPGSTSNGGGAVYVTSTVRVVPQPITTDIYGSHGGGSGNGGNAPETGLPGGPGGSGGSAGSECGPATVTVTNADTVTVTVTPAAPVVSSGAGEGSGESSSPIGISTAPVPVSNSSPIAGTGTGVAPAPAPITTSTSSTVPAAVPAPSSTSSNPVEIYSPLAAQEKNKKPHNAQHHSPAAQATSTTPAQAAYTPAQSVYTPPAAYTPPIVYTPPETKPSVAGGESPSAAEASSPAVVVQASSSAVVVQASSSAAAPKKSSTPSKVGAKGLIYNNAEQANSMDVAWACNWGQTPGVSNPNFEYVPQLWGPKLDFGETIAKNAAGSDFVLFYNEPDIPTSQGGCGVDVGTTVQDWHTYMKPLQDQGKLVSTPCVANSNGAFMDTFLSSFPHGTMDVLCFHWYGPEIEGLKRTVDEFKGYADKYGIKQLWISEMAVLPLPADLSEYISYLDGAVDRYAYNLNNLGTASY